MVHVCVGGSGWRDEGDERMIDEQERRNKNIVRIDGCVVGGMGSVGRDFV